jgi:phospholipid transport system transporter-binding protein
LAQVKQQDNALRFSGDLLIDNISEVLAQVDALKLTAPLTLDFSYAKEVDTSAISFVLEMQRRVQALPVGDAVKSTDKRVELVGVSDNFRSLMQLYGVDSFLLS